uniref:Major facilitator superfamily domain containing 4B n=1 Tax=Leptobrachium leishanense TaxID=445787 RepID=A0A8C5Q4X4_9ANUR
MQGAASKKQVRFAAAEEAGEEEDTLFEKQPARLRDGDGAELESGRKRPAADQVRLVPDGRRGRRGERCLLQDLRCCVTTVLCAAFLGLGMAIAVLGPTFPDLAENVESNVANISYIFVGRSCGYLGGSVLGGILFERMNQHLLLGGNVVIMNTWGEQSGPHVQALHFSFALGAFVAPILAKVVLERLPLDSINIPSSLKPSSEQSDLPLGIKKSMLSYIVIGTYILLVSLFLFILYAKSRPNQSTEKGSEDKLKTAKYHNALIFLLFLFFFSYVGAEVAYGSYIYTYATTFPTVHMAAHKAAGLNSVFWGVFAAVRGLAICFATCLYPGTMLLLSVIGCSISSLCLVLFNTNEVVLWIGSALYGASMATTFPSGFSWVQQYTTISGKSASIFVVGAALGEMAIPASVGYLQGMFSGVPVLMYTILISSTVTSVLFPVMYKLATSPTDKIRWNGVESEDRKALLSNSGLEEEEEEEEARHWNEADFEAVEMNDRSTNSAPVILEETLEATSALVVNNLTHPLEANGTDTDGTVNKSPSKMLLNVNREKKD